jgi:LysR family transcriptional regulator, transcriptional activator of the cysJI operon
VLPCNYNHLYYFYRVAVHRSVSKASKELLIAQSALSTQLKQLEDSLETTLFNRTKGGMELTERGEIVFRYASQMFEMYDEMRRAMLLAEREVRGPLNIASVNSIGIYLLPRILTAYSRRYPDVQIHVELQSSNKVMEMLQENQVELSLITWNRQYPLLQSKVVMQNHLVLVTNPKLPLAKKKQVALSDLVGQKFIGYEAGTPTRMLIDAHFKNLGLPLDYVIESANTAAIKQLVLEGMGAAFLPEIAVRLEIKQKLLKVIEVSEAQMDRPITVYWKERRVLSRPAQKMLELLQEMNNGAETAVAVKQAENDED